MSSTENLIKTLTNKGWCFSDADDVRAIITVHSAVAAHLSAVESELCNLYLLVVGGKSLPDSSLLRNPSVFIHPPKVLQVRLEKKVVVHYGIACLTPDAITVLGGVVSSLYEEWQMNQKYAGFSRSSLRKGQEGDEGGSPPFEKLQTGIAKHSSARHASRNSEPSVTKSSKQSNIQHMEKHQASYSKGDSGDINLSKAEEKSTDTRPKEVADNVPIQNQAAAQKLLQKMTNPGHNSERHRGHRFKGKGREEDKQVYTLDEWERRKAGGVGVAREEPLDLSRDEFLS